jgi:hypothetical protein
LPDTKAVDSTHLVGGLIGCVSLLYATAGQAGGTAFLAIMAFAAFPATEMRATAEHRRGGVCHMAIAPQRRYRPKDAVAVDGAVTGLCG